MTKVKMRDVPWSEVTNHFKNEPSNAEEIWETEMRGKIVQLTGNTAIYNFLQKDRTELKVKGYETTFLLDEGYFWACSVCAEIGD